MFDRKNGMYVGGISSSTQYNRGDSSGEREMEKEFIKEFYGWLEMKCDELAGFNNSWGVTVNQESALTRLGNEIIKQIGYMPIAANGVTFKVIRIENSRVYTFMFEVTADKRGDIRRETDSLSLRFTHVPGYGQNPVVEHAKCSTEESIFTMKKFTICMPFEIHWNM